MSLKKFLSLMEQKYNGSASRSRIYVSKRIYEANNDTLNPNV